MLLAFLVWAALLGPAAGAPAEGSTLTPNDIYYSQSGQELSIFAPAVEFAAQPLLAQQPAASAQECAGLCWQDAECKLWGFTDCAEVEVRPQGAARWESRLRPLCRQLADGLQALVWRARVQAAYRANCTECRLYGDDECGIAPVVGTLQPGVPAAAQVGGARAAARGRACAEALHARHGKEAMEWLGSGLRRAHSKALLLHT